MEEQIEGLLKEKEQAQVDLVSTTTIPISVAGTKASSSLEIAPSSSTMADSTKLTEELALKKQQNEKLLDKFQNLELQKVKMTLYM